MKEIGGRDVLRKNSETCSIIGLKRVQVKERQCAKIDPDHRTKYELKNLPTLDSSKE